MISESRTIILSDAELTSAVRPLLSEVSVNIDETPECIDIKHDADGGLCATFTFADTDPVILNHQQLGAAILHHCMAQRIPLPRDAEKELTLRGDQVAMIMRLEQSS